MTKIEKENIEMRNEDLKVEIISDALKGVKIGLCITGGIAALESYKIARHLRRHGADVTAYMTPCALKFLTPMALEWATEKDVITEMSGRAEHICLEDLIVIAPATLNTINKIFAGIGDNIVTTLVASALGKKVPVYIAPCMHDSLYKNPIFQDNLKKSEEYRIKVIEPRFSENKAKIANLMTITDSVLKYFKENPKLVLK